jgi:hypothetical protein
MYTCHCPCEAALSLYFNAHLAVAYNDANLAHNAHLSVACTLGTQRTSDYANLPYNGQIN